MVVDNVDQSESLTDLFRPKKPKGLRSRDLSSTRLLLLKQEIETNAHILPLNELFKQLGTNPTIGLTSKRAHELLHYYGYNSLTPATQSGWFVVLIKSLCTGFSVLIWLGALLCLVAYLIELGTRSKPSRDNLYLGCVLISVDVICGLFSFYQNFKSSKIMKTFNNMIPSYTSCLRDGEINEEMPVHNIVKGDIVFVRAGDVVPADMRVIDSKGFKVDNSSLTGESVAVARSNVEGIHNILESPNVAFFSTLCVEGWAKGVVLCCGDLTALGRVAGLVARLQPAPSPLAREIKRFMHYVAMWALTLGFFIAVSSFALGYAFIQTSIFVIGIIVANIPEGLQPTVTASLTLTAQKMVSKQCLVKNLDSIEALGACTIICSDKTGTLTENKMSVQHVWMCTKTYYVQDADFLSALQNQQALINCSALCSNAVLKSSGGVAGDASEVAILNFLFKYNDPIAIRKRFPKIVEIPFNSVNKFQASVHLDTSSSRYLIVMKGAPEIIISRCSTIAIDKKNYNLSKEMKADADRTTENLANTGERIMAFADLLLDPKQFPLNYPFDSENINFPLEGLRLIGIMGIMDPPREEVRSAIERVRAAGVRVMMVTGDHPATARAIALDVSIATSSKCHVVTGTELRNMTDDLLNWTLDKHYEIVFARTSPTQKLQIVEACQRRGDVVAVTGDGVNDAPALRRADIGISMGITGSQVSQQTADIILLDDNFATIVTGIEEGRKIFDNLKKSVCYILISNVPEVLPVLMFILFSIPLPLGVMTILCVDLGTDMWPAVALAYEQVESDVMRRPPSRSEGLVSARMIRLAYGHLGLIEFAAGMFAYFIVMAEFGFQPKQLFGVMTILCVDLGTDMWPAVALAYEQVESDVMRRPPSRSEGLVSARMIRLAYGHLGLIEFAAGMFAYFIVMAEFGFQPKQLFGIRKSWDNKAVSDVQDSYGQEWTYNERKEVERAAQAAYFIAVVVMQAANGLVCKTRYNSLLHVGLKNNVLNCGIIFELFLALFLCYTPGINTFFSTYPLKIRWWFLALPFVAYMLAFDEFRKFCIRRRAFGGWFNSLTYY